MIRVRNRKLNYAIFLPFIHLSAKEIMYIYITIIYYEILYTSWRYKVYGNSNKRTIFLLGSVGKRGRPSRTRMAPSTRPALPTGAVSQCRLKAGRERGDESPKF